MIDTDNTKDTAGDDAPVVLGEGRWLRLVRRGRWESVERIHNQHGDHATCLVAVTDDDELLLVEQHRPALGCATIELPAGLVGDERGSADEAAEDAADRELIEETGFAASSLERLTQGCVSAGLTSEQTILFRATGLNKVGPGGGIGHEDIIVHRVPLTELDGWLAQCQARGAVVDLKVYAGLHFARHP